MTEFKVGDRVRLTGDGWYGGSLGPGKGEVVEITRVNDVLAFFEWGSDEWFIEEGGYDAELVTDEGGQEVTKFKVGDKVRLTGGEWGAPDEPPRDTVVEITRVHPTGRPVFKWGSEEWFIYDGYDAELVTAAPEEIKHVHIGQDSISVSDPADAIDPDHYKFPGGTEVIDITRHLGFLEGNVVKYVTRAGRKGDRLEDLKKAAQYLQWAIEDATNAGM